MAWVSRGPGGGNSKADGAPRRPSGFWFENPTGSLQSPRLRVGQSRSLSTLMVGFFLALSLIQPAPERLRGAHSVGGQAPCGQLSAVRW